MRAFTSQCGLMTPRRAENRHGWSTDSPNSPDHVLPAPSSLWPYHCCPYPLAGTKEKTKKFLITPTASTFRIQFIFIMQETIMSDKMGQTDLRNYTERVKGIWRNETDNISELSKALR